jgi:hypothetical protein
VSGQIVGTDNHDQWLESRRFNLHKTHPFFRCADAAENLLTAIVKGRRDVDYRFRCGDQSCSVGLLKRMITVPAVC